jgi:hypothetical protein
MPELQNNEAKASETKSVLFVVSSLFVAFIVLLVLWQVFQRSVKGGGTVDLRFVIWPLLICGLLPWGALAAYMVAIRRSLPLWGAFVSNVTAWIVAFLVFAFSVASSYKADTGVRSLMPLVGIVVSQVLFGLLQFAGWRPGIPRGQRRRAVSILVLFPTLLALTVWYVVMALQNYLNRTLTVGKSTLVIISTPFLSAAILTTCILAHYLRMGLEKQHPTAAGQVLDQPEMIADTGGDPQS